MVLMTGKNKENQVYQAERNMHARSVILPLIREEQTFSACAAIVRGELATGAPWAGQLHPEEKAAYDAFPSTRRKESFLLGRLSARQAVLGLTGIDTPHAIWIDTGVFQFPVVRGAGLRNIQVSISHCDNIGFSVAFPEAHPLGVDVEKVGGETEEAVLSQLTGKEKMLLRSCGQDHTAGYTAVFSMKEALSKILRTGMMLDFQFLEVEEAKVLKGALACTFTHFGQYKAFARFQKPHVFSMALPRRTAVHPAPLWRLLEEG